MSPTPIDRKMVFAIAPAGEDREVPLVLLGIPAGAWDHMKDGMCHTFDLASVGVPVQLMLYGAADHTTAMQLIEDSFSARKESYLDLRRQDFAIKLAEPAGAPAPKYHAADLMRRRVPSLAEWLGDGSRADSFEDYVAESILAERATNTPAEAAMLRILRIFSIACVEACRTETEIHEREVGQTLVLLARAAGLGVMAPVLCAAADDLQGIPELITVLTEEFRHGLSLLATANGVRADAEG